MVELKEITKHNYKDILKISVLEEQKNYVMTTEQALAAAYAYRDCIHPFAVYIDDEVIGFVMCRYNEAYNNYFLWELIIDAKHQNKGYGKLTLFSLLGWISLQDKSKEVVTTVIKGNTVAEKLYRDIGFTDINEQCEDEIDLIYVMG